MHSLVSTVESIWTYLTMVSVDSTILQWLQECVRGKDFYTLNSTFNPMIFPGRYPFVTILPSVFRYIPLEVIDYVIVNVTESDIAKVLENPSEYKNGWHRQLHTWDLSKLVPKLYQYDPVPPSKIHNFNDNGWWRDAARIREMIALEAEDVKLRWKQEFANDAYRMKRIAIDERLKHLK